jgi:lysyl-tRNA synthetase class 2
MIIDQDFLRALQYGMPPPAASASALTVGDVYDRPAQHPGGDALPQLKPEKKMPQSSIAEWAEIGVPENWVYVLRKAGFNLISDIVDEKAQGLQQKIGEINKKYKLDYEKPSVDDIQQWIEKAKDKSLGHPPRQGGGGPGICMPGRQI